MVADRDPADRALLVFVHVPKAAGTTLSRLISDRYPQRRLAHFNNPELAEARLAAMTPEALDEIEAVTGHVTYGIHRHFSRPAQYVTMLRHPVARIASHYRYVRSTPIHYLHAAVVERDLDLVAYAQSGLSPELSDGQVRMFSARARELEECDEASLDEAKRVLAEEFEVVGLAERFDESLLLMQTALGWSAPYYIRENRSARVPVKLAEEAVEAIEAANRLDLELYEFAEELLARRIDADEGLTARVVRFRRRNRAFGPASKLMRLRRRLG